jgi:hypothetical protein
VDVDVDVHVDVHVDVDVDDYVYDYVYVPRPRPPPPPPPRRVPVHVGSPTPRADRSFPPCVRHGTMRRSLLALCTLAALAAVIPATAPHAHPAEPSRWRPPATQAIEIELVDAFGHALPTIRHRGQLFVAGEKGERYSVRVRNPSAERIEVVVSVDGRDVVSGSLADPARDRGYVIEPFGSVAIDGFRTSMRHVAAFRFSSVPDSYAARRGTPSSVGVIGIAVFQERTAQAIARRSEPRRSASGAASTPAPSSSQARRPGKPAESSASQTRRWTDARPRTRELGTEFGERRSSVVVEVPFVRRSTDRPDFVTTVAYDTPRGLAARGVPVEPVLAVERARDPSAKARPRRFAPPPPPPR